MTGVKSVPAHVREAHSAAKKNRRLAHAPYSHYRVGAALIAADGTVFTGCNIENASYGGAVCAERVAILKAVSSGVNSFTDIVVVTEDESPAFPCALCLQTMAEFFGPDVKIWIGGEGSLRDVRTFGELLPAPFGPTQLRDSKAAGSTTKKTAKGSRKA